MQLRVQPLPANHGRVMGISAAKLPHLHPSSLRALCTCQNQHAAAQTCQVFLLVSSNLDSRCLFVLEFTLGYAVTTHVLTLQCLSSLMASSFTFACLACAQAQLAGSRGRINQHSQKTDQLAGRDMHASPGRRKLQSKLPIAAHSPLQRVTQGCPSPGPTLGLSVFARTRAGQRLCSCDTSGVTEQT